MTMQLRKAIDTMRAVRRDARIWARHLTGEGPTTVRRQREAVTRALAAGPLAAQARNEEISRPEASSLAVTPWAAIDPHQPADPLGIEGRALKIPFERLTAYGAASPHGRL